VYWENLGSDMADSGMEGHGARSLMVQVRVGRMCIVVLDLYFDSEHVDCF
jgi:hypothetical protein